MTTITIVNSYSVILLLLLLLLLSLFYFEMLTIPAGAG